MTKDEAIPPMTTPPVSSSSDSRPQETQLKRGAFEPPVVPGTLGHLGRFDILRLLGEGGMGQAYLAREPLTDTLVAVKIMRPELAGEPYSTHRFLTEARHMYRLSHPHILRVLEVSGRKEGPYYVMPFMGGGSLLGQYNPDRPLPEERALAVSRQIADALAHAHAHGIIHRDIKPANVLLDGEGNAYLTDFGLVRTVFNDSMVDASATHLEGTAPYMSPAVARGEAEDTRCDIYAFGALLYELLTGRPPYTGRALQLIIDQVLKGPPTPVRTLSPKASLSLVKVAEGCMARELRDRYATMSDVVGDLDRIAKGKAPFGPHCGKRISHARVAALVVGALTVTGFIGTALVFPKADLRQTLARLARLVPSRNRYLVIDLSKGTNALTFPVRHLARVPPDGWSDAYKTDQLVLRRIEPGSFVMGSPANELGRNEEETQHRVTLSEAFYMGVFEVTQRQWELVMGNRPSKFFVDYAARPVERVGYDDIRGAGKGAGWPQSGAVDEGSFMGVLRTKTGLPHLDLPTEAQWEYACRAGTTEALSSRKNLTNAEACPHLAELGRHQGNTLCGHDGENNVTPYEGGTAVVGSFPANPWGLYDMHGNILEWCLDWRGFYQCEERDPVGALRGSGRVERGVAWRGPAKFGRSASRQSHGPDSREDFQGFRAAMTLTDMKDRGRKVCGAPVVSLDPEAPFAYVTNNGSVTICRYLGPGGEVVIPGRINEMPVTGIDSQAFSSCTNMTRVTIPESVTRIGNNTFGFCTGLTSVSLPASVVKLGCNPFNCCSALRSITVDAANPAYSGSEDGVLFDKEKTKLVCCPGGKQGEYEIPGSVVRILPGAFYGCKGLVRVTIPDSVTAFSLWAFKECVGLTSITIPGGVTIIENNAFYGCSRLTHVYFKGDMPGSDSVSTLFQGANQVTVFYLPGAKGWGKEFGGRPTAAWRETPQVAPANSAL